MLRLYSQLSQPSRSQPRKRSWIDSVALPILSQPSNTRGCPPSAGNNGFRNDGKSHVERSACPVQRRYLSPGRCRPWHFCAAERRGQNASDSAARNPRWRSEYPAKVTGHAPFSNCRSIAHPQHPSARALINFGTASSHQRHRWDRHDDAVSQVDFERWTVTTDGGSLTGQSVKSAQQSAIVFDCGPGTRFQLARCNSHYDRGGQTPSFLPIPMQAL